MTGTGDDMSGQTSSLCVRRATYWDPEMGKEDPAKKGVCSNYLCDSKPGDDCKMTGPSGKVMLMPEENSKTDYIMVATGTGIAPYRGFIRRLFTETTPAGEAYKGLAWLFLGVANSDALLYDEEWQAAKSKFPDNFRVDYALSREEKNKKGGKMYIQDKVEEYADEIFERLQNGAVMYFCGLKGMMPGIQDMLKEVCRKKGLTYDDFVADLEALEDFVGVLLDLVLDIHLAALLVLLLARERVVDAEIVGKLALGRLPLLVVEEGVAVGDAEEEPRQALVGLAGGRRLREEAADEAAVRRDARAGRDHDVVRVRFFFGHEHDLARRARHLDLLAGRGVAQKVRADALLRRVLLAHVGVPVSRAADTQRRRLAGHVVAVARRRDGVEAHRVRLAVLRVRARRDDAVGLALPVGHVALVVEDDVARLARGLGADDALARHDLRRVGALVLEGVHGHRGLVPVGRGLEEVLLLAGRRLGEDRALVAAEEAREQAHAWRRAERVGAAERER